MDKICTLENVKKAIKRAKLNKMFPLRDILEIHSFEKIDEETVKIRVWIIDYVFTEIFEFMFKVKNNKLIYDKEFYKQKNSKF